MKFEDLEDVLEELKSFYFDINAEVIMSEIFKKTSITLEDIVVKNQSTFKRSFRRDIIDVGPIENDIIPIHLSRNGLYDQLPEGVFHKIGRNNSESSFSKIRKTFKEEEKEARYFFLPFENEFFRQQINIEKNEQNLIQDIFTFRNSFLKDFWKIDKNIPNKYFIKLVKLLPHSSKIHGDIELARICLEKLIEKKVVIRKQQHPKSNNQNISFQGQHLGRDLTLGAETYHSSFPILEVEISLDDYDTFNQILKDSPFLNAINIFYEYFFPVEYEIKTKFKDSKNTPFILDKTKKPIVGLTTQI
ncbi:MAG: hypothetical protein HWD82_06400 [Flavobacteriaceae bacterium]|nr:hypothetical protein [Flavobacteriaceae bacterium]